jgi:hypothetical protein
LELAHSQQAQRVMQMHIRVFWFQFDSLLVMGLRVCESSLITQDVCQAEMSMSQICR